MPSYKLPEPLYSWAWTPEYLAKIECDEQISDGGIILPDSSTAVDDRPALVNFSTLDILGYPRYWLWLFPSVGQAAALRAMPQAQLQAIGDMDGECELIDAALPQSRQGEEPSVDLTLVDARWLSRQCLEDLGILEVWVGFSWQQYIGKRHLRASADLILSAGDFREIATR